MLGFPTRVKGETHLDAFAQLLQNVQQSSQLRVLLVRLRSFGFFALWRLRRVGLE
jgi:hypothetical protein